MRVINLLFNHLVEIRREISLSKPIKRVLSMFKKSNKKPSSNLTQQPSNPENQHPSNSWSN